MAVLAAAVMFSVLPGPSFGQNPGQGKGRGGKNKLPFRPTPHMPDGHVMLGPLPGEKGLWNGSAGTSLENSPRQVDNPGLNLPSNLQAADVPFLPWARAVFDHRTETLTADDPHVRCKASGGPRLYTTPYGLEFVEVPEMRRIFVMGVGGPHTWRVFYLDGRPHPADLDPTFYGHSIAHWEGGDALVVDTVAFNERFWLSREGVPHTEKLHLIERFTRTDYNNLKYEATVDDPGAYTATWTGGWNIPWNPNGEMYEFVCQDNNRDVRHMYGGER
jgi:hypothetical protein